MARTRKGYGIWLAIVWGLLITKAIVFSILAEQYEMPIEPWVIWVPALGAAILLSFFNRPSRREPTQATEGS